jgi:hypothetical protein
METNDIEALPRFVMQNIPNGCDPDVCEWDLFIGGNFCGALPTRVIVEVGDLFHDAHLCDKHILLAYDKMMGKKNG